MKLLNRVVFIDDDPYTNEYHRLFAKRINLAKEVMFFEKAEDALKYLDGIENKYDFPELILVDVNMPLMDGHQFVARINDMSGYNSIRTMVAFLTSSKNIADVIKADEEQVEFYYWKPLDNKLIKRILKDGFNMDFEPGNDYVKLDIKRIAQKEK